MVDTIAALYADEDVMGAFADWFEFTRLRPRDDPVDQGDPAHLPGRG